MTETPEVSAQEPEKNVAPVSPSREPLFGALLFGIFLIFLVVIIAGMSWGIYRGYRLSQEQAVLPSISTIALGEIAEEKAEAAKEEAVTEEKTSNDTASEEAVLKKAQATKIKVLNGGAPKGSASVIEGILKQAGFTQIEIGNTLKDYTGVVIYFAPEVEKEAEVVKATLLKSYPKTTVQPAVKTNTETTQAPLSIIFGK
ncbi:MAG: LytR C-terminal domain-containing protein [Candidatus Moranbacteria bacterium]|nr:LytR C-terminal domain-containing protein [Candidatus Moranbacteria bacterium]